jgi:hypothetical protein
MKICPTNKDGVLLKKNPCRFRHGFGRRDTAVHILAVRGHRMLHAFVENTERDKINQSPVTLMPFVSF